MFKNFILSAHRNVIRNKLQSIIQILSLAIGITIFSLVALYLYDEFTVDNSNEYRDQVFRVENRGGPFYSRDVLPVNIATIIQNNIPEIKYLTRIIYSPQPDKQASYLEDPDLPGKQAETNYIWVDSNFQQVFPQEYLLGNPATSLDALNSIVITESLAGKLFGRENPLGKTIYINIAYQNIDRAYTVTGVIKDPKNTHLKFEAMAPIATMMRHYMKDGLIQGSDQWVHNFQRPIYIRLHEKSDINAVQGKIVDVIQNLYSGIDLPGVELISQDLSDLEINLRLLKDVPFSDIAPRWSYMRTANRKNLMSFLILGLGILFLGIINYINLCTARASLRTKEIAIRKIVGSSRFKLVVYFLIESIITAFFAFLVSATLLQLFFVRFNNLLQADINLYFLSTPAAWIAIIFSILFIGILSGIYPAIQMASVKPLVAFAGESAGMGNGRGDGKGILTRRILMVLQFSSAGVLLIGIITMHTQIRHMMKQDLGFDTEQIVTTEFVGFSSEAKVELLSRLANIPEVEKTSLHNLPLGASEMARERSPRNDPESPFHGESVYFMRTDLEFFEIYDLEFIFGEDILKQESHRMYSRDSTDAPPNHQWIVNETYWNIIREDIEDPVGYRFPDVGVLMGVVKDFHFQSLKSPIKPLIMELGNLRNFHSLSIKINSPNIMRTFRQIEKEFNYILDKYEEEEDRVPGLSRPPVKFSFVEDIFNTQYDQIIRIRTASLYFSILAVLIAIMGLFGLSTFMAQRRTKEVGIRKALGASDTLIFTALSRDFIKWVSISVLISLPLGWFIMSKWLQQFASRADIGIWVYALTALLMLIIALTTVTWQSIRTARANPVDSLRFE